ncbi:MAG: hypothetical protein ABUK01_10950, partial [Leptospirales bacterium]
LPVSVCGEAAAKIPSLLLLIGLGFENFSVSPLNLPQIGGGISQYTQKFAENLVKEVRTIHSPLEREKLAKQYMKKNRK